MLKGHVFKNQRFGNHIFALFMNTFLGGKNGVINGYKNSMSINYSGSELTIGAGAVCIQGRFLEEDSSAKINVGTNTLYCKLILEIDLDKENTETDFNQAYYKIVSGESGYTGLTTDDIVGKNSGVYQYELCRFKTGLSGISSFEDTRTYLDFDSIYSALEKASNVVFKNELQTELKKYVSFKNGKIEDLIRLAQKLTIESGGIEIFDDTPYVDFHQGRSTADWTHRIIGSENEVGTIPSGKQFHFCAQGGVVFRKKYGTSKDDIFASFLANEGVSVIGVPDYLTIRKIDDLGVYKAISASAFNTSSSKRYKKNIVAMTDEEANKLDEIDVMIFDYIKEENGTGQAGMIAEDVYNVLPNAVTLAKIDGKMVPDSIDYSKFVPYLIKRDKMKSKKISILEKTVEELLRRIEVLEDKV